LNEVSLSAGGEREGEREAPSTIGGKVKVYQRKKGAFYCQGRTTCQTRWSREKKKKFERRQIYWVGGAYQVDRANYIVPTGAQKIWEALKRKLKRNIREGRTPSKNSSSQGIKKELQR